MEIGAHQDRVGCAGLIRSTKLIHYLQGEANLLERADLIPFRAEPTERLRVAVVESCMVESFRNAGYA